MSALLRSAPRAWRAWKRAPGLAVMRVALCAWGLASIANAAPALAGASQTVAQHTVPPPGDTAAAGRGPAIVSLRDAAGQDDAEAQQELGTIYREGDGVPRDDHQAARWYFKAASHGLANAQFWLGQLYAGGEGVAKNPANAFKWTRRAARQGHALAQYALALMYADGDGVEQSAAQAIQWMTIARAADAPGAQEKLESLARAAPVTERERGRQLAEDWESFKHDQAYREKLYHCPAQTIYKSVTVKSAALLFEWCLDSTGKKHGVLRSTRLTDFAIDSETPYVHGIKQGIGAKFDAEGVKEGEIVFENGVNKRIIFPREFLDKMCENQNEANTLEGKRIRMRMLGNKTVLVENPSAVLVAANRRVTSVRALPAHKRAPLCAIFDAWNAIPELMLDGIEIRTLSGAGEVIETVKLTPADCIKPAR